MAGIIHFFAKKQTTDEFEALMRPHVSYLYRVAYRLTNNPDAAEDLLQDIMLHFYPRLQELKRIESLRPWLVRSVYNRFIDNVRKNKRNPVSEALEESVLEVVADHAAEPERETEQDLMNQRISQALDLLNDDQRDVVMLHDMEGYTLTELAEIMAVPVGTLKSRLHRARNSIKEFLSMEPSETLMRVKG